MSELYIAENILNKYYPTERTVFRESILKAMMEYGRDLELQIAVHKEANSILADNQDEADMANKFYKRAMELARAKEEFEQRYIIVNAKQAIRIQKLEEELSKFKEQ